MPLRSWLSVTVDEPWPSPVKRRWSPPAPHHEVRVGQQEDGTFLWYRYLVETSPVPACRWDVLASECPSRQVLGRVANKWTMLVISALAESDVLRFSQLRRRVQGVTQKMLTQTLRGLERDGLVSRTVYPTVPATVEYRLTPLGISLADAVSAIKEWAYANIDQIEHARKLYDAVD